MSEHENEHENDGEAAWTMSFTGSASDASEDGSEDGTFVASGPSWWAPDEDSLPGVVPRNIVLGVSPTAAVYLTALRAYPDGVVMMLCIRVAAGSADLVISDHEGSWPQPPSEGGLRWSFTFADGSSVSSADDWGVAGDGPSLTAAGGTSSDRSSTTDYHLHPLPPPGPVVISCGWPDRDLPVTEQVVDAALFRDAADQAHPLWPAPPS